MKMLPRMIITVNVTCITMRSVTEAALVMIGPIPKLAKAMTAVPTTAIEPSTADDESCRRTSSGWPNSIWSQ